MLNGYVGQNPFLNLGLLIGGKAQRLCFWYPLLDRIKKKLSG